MKKTVVLLMLISIMSKIIGFGREIVLSYMYGTSNIADAYLISITVPSVVFGFISVGIIAAYIPMYSKIQQEKGELESNKFTSNLINILVLLSAVIIFLSYVYAESIVKVFAVGFEGETLQLAVNFTRMSLFAICFTGVVSILSGYLQMKGNYIIPALIGFPLNLFILVSIVLSKKTSIYLLAIGYVIAVASQLLLILPYVKKSGYVHKRIIYLKDESITNMMYIALPVILGTSVNQINVLVDRTLASQITVGGISALNYANRLSGFVQGIFVSSVVTVLYPLMSRMSAEMNVNGLKKSLNEAIVLIMLLVIPSTFGFMFFSNDIISLLFGRGAFDVSATLLTSSALFFYSIGMLGVGLREVASRVFYSMQDTKTPMINAAIGMVLNIILNIILSKYLGIGGLALATSIAATFTCGLMFVTLRQKIGSFEIKKTIISFLKITVASSIMATVAKITSIYLNRNYLNHHLSLIIAMFIGATLYFVVIYFMKIEDVDSIVNLTKKKLFHKFDKHS